MGRAIEAICFFAALAIVVSTLYRRALGRYEDYPRRCFMRSAEQAGRENR